MQRPLLIIAATFACAACRRAEITHHRVPKGPETALASTAPHRAHTDEMAAPPASAGSSALKWTLPKGWTESVASGMRYATLKPAGKGRVEVSMVVLAGPAGGELANVNRWRGQIGLGPIDERALSAARSSVGSKAGPIAVYDFSSEGANKTRLVAGLLLAEESTWFVKMLGDEGAVASARPDFLTLLRSLRFDVAN